MQLNNLNSAWQQLKVVSSMQQLDSNEILSIIEDSRQGRTRLEKILFSVVVFTAITIFCQGG